MPDINFGILTNPVNTNPIKTSMGSAAPIAPSSPSAPPVTSPMQLLRSVAPKSTSPQAPGEPLAPASMQSSGILPKSPADSPIGSNGFDTKNHTLADILDPNVQSNAIHSAVAAAGQPGASPFDVAQSYVGQGRRSGAGAMEGFFKKSLGQNVDIQSTPWCAAFANSVLASTGHGQTGSLAARSFLNYGESTKTPSQGDVVVMQRGGKDSGLGHVGFFDGYSADHKSVRVLAGNTNGQVMTKEYPLNSVLDYRVPPTSQELQSKANQPQEEQLANSSNPGTRNRNSYNPSAGGYV